MSQLSKLGNFPWKASIAVWIRIVRGKGSVDMKTIRL